MLISLPRAWVVVVVLAVLSIVSTPAMGSPQPERDGESAIRADADRNIVNLRVGGSSENQSGKMIICGEVTPVWRLSIEGCGSGSGIIHNDDGVELSHYRAKVVVYSTINRWGAVRAQVGLGFAELQLAADAAGFQFGSTGEQNIETAGPESSASVQWFVPLSAGFEFVMNGTVGAAYLPHAPELSAPQSRWQPFASLELGLGW